MYREDRLSRRKAEGFDDSPTVVSLERALIILDLLSTLPGGMGPTEISHRLGYSPGTVQKILNTLIMRGIVTQTASEGYRLGIGALRLANQILSQLDMVSLIRPFLEALAAETGESTALAMNDGVNAIYVDKVPGKHDIRLDVPLSVARPLTTTAVGKVILAHESSDLFDQVSAAYRLDTQHVAALRAEIEQVRSTGYALDLREYDPLVIGAAAPILDHEGKLVAALSVGGPAERLAARSLELAEKAKEIANHASAELGFRP